jgi:tetratricopeptide (TPR) repeat protein
LPVIHDSGLLTRWHAALLQAFGLEAAALRVLDQRCEKHPLDAETRARRTHLLALAGAWPAALADSERVLALQADSAAAWFNHGYLLDQCGHWAEARRAFERATHLDPQLDRAWYGLGLALIRQGQLEEAAAALTRNTALQPLSPFGWYQLARVQVDLEQTAAARESLQRLKAFDRRVAAQLMQDTGLTVHAEA